MFVEEIKNIKSGKKELRQFGLILGVVFGLLAGFFFWRGKDFYFYFFIFSLLFLFFALFFPLLLNPVRKGWMALSLIMGWVVTRIILALLFYLVITPIGLLTRLLGKDFLKLRFKKNEKDTYWISKERVKFKKGNYESQY